MITIPGKIPVRIHAYFWILALIIGWLNSFSDITSLNSALIKTALWVAVITISVIVHEFGHALSAVAFGQKASIDLVGFGGLTQRSGSKLSLWQEFLIILCGPLFGFVLALLTYYILSKVDEKTMNMGVYALEITFYINVFWTFINLLPVQPLDGGRLLSIILEGIFGFKGIKVALFLSMIISVVAGLFFFARGSVIAGSLFFMFAFENYRAWQDIRPVHEQDHNVEVQELLKNGEEDLHAGRKDEAFEKFKLVREMTKSGVLYLRASAYSVFILEDKKEYRAAYEMLLPLKKELNFSALKVLQRLAYQNHDLKEAVEIGNEIFAENPDYEVAFTNALAYAENQQAKQSVGWLESAIRHGMPHAEVILSKNEFDPIRDTPAFKKLKASLIL